MKVAMYLRKSRADEEMERTLGQGETLAKHRKALLRFAKEKDLNIVKIYEEVVSGESLIHRPEMLQMLKDIELNSYDAVLVMDMQRLGRGDMQDQGVILKTFKNSGTKIITPMKTYDLSNDFDEEYTEFEAFMSRKELKMINRRMQSGRIRSVEDGNYISPNPPYGYEIYEDKISRTLIPHPDQSHVIKLIFDMYTNNAGAGTIATELNKMGYRSYTGIEWTNSSILNIIKNPVYIGKVTWKKKCIRKSTDPDKINDVYQRPKSEWIVADGKHKPIIDIDVFNRAQEILNSRYHIPYQLENGARNPLAGILVCGVCGSKMIYRPYGTKAPHIMCTKKCGNKSSKFEYVEKKLLAYLDSWLKESELEIELPNKNSTETEAFKKQLFNLEKELSTLNSQKLKLHDFLEQGVYDVNTFLERSNNISERVDVINKNIEVVKSSMQKTDTHLARLKFVKQAKKVLYLYNKTSDVSQKNMLLKSILEKVVYNKDKKQKEDDFTLNIFPRL